MSLLADLEAIGGAQALGRHVPRILEERRLNGNARPRSVAHRLQTSRVKRRVVVPPIPSADEPFEEASS